jgi:hypothetical protein
MEIIKTNQKGTKYIENEKGEVLSKECTECKQVLNIDFFHKRESGLGGKYPRCKQCCKSYKEKNRDRLSKYYKRRNEEKREVRRSQNREYYRMNKDRIIEKSKKYYKENEKEVKAYVKDWYDRNRAEISKRKKKYNEENPHIRKSIRQRYKARRYSLPQNLTTNQTKQLLSIGCILTGEKNDLHLDHFIPLSWGHGGTTFENMIPLSAELNISKNNRNPFEWIKTRNDIDISRWNAAIEHLARLNGMTAKEFEEYVYWCENNKREVTEEAN